MTAIGHLARHVEDNRIMFGTTTIRILDAEWQFLDRERPAMSLSEQEAVVERQQTIEGILRTLGQAL